MSASNAAAIAALRAQIAPLIAAPSPPVAAGALAGLLADWLRANIVQGDDPMIGQIQIALEQLADAATTGLVAVYNTGFWRFDVQFPQSGS